MFENVRGDWSSVQENIEGAFTALHGEEILLAGGLKEKGGEIGDLPGVEQLVVI